MSEAKINRDLDISSDRARVTIAIPCFKQEAFLFECLNSLITQTMPSWQAFVVDDCSPGATAQRIASSYNDPRIRCIRHEVNRGLAASRNTGLQAGYAPFVLCIDADDFLHRDFLSATLEVIENQRADCAYTVFQCFGVSNRLWFNQEPKSTGDLAREQWLPGPGVMMLRSVWEGVGGYSPDLAYNEDLDFWIAALQSNISVAYVPRPLYFYRRHGHSMTATQPDGERITREVILKRHPAFFAVGNRKKVFRAGGFIAAAYAHRALGHRRQWAVLTARAISVDPRLVYPEAKAIVRALARRAKRKIKSIAGSDSKEYYPSDENTNNLPPRDWDSLALAIHDQYGYLSDDFSVLGQVVDKTEANSVLEVGCGSGRLVPVYLAHNVQTILLQDVSEQALDLCRQRFFCQEHISYFHGDVRIIPTSASPDLIVANRVLQHILNDGEFTKMMKYLTSIGRWFYINEAGVKEAVLLGDPYLKGRDYIQIFVDLGCRLVQEGELTAEYGGRHRWMLFEK